MVVGVQSADLKLQRLASSRRAHVVYAQIRRPLAFQFRCKIKPHHIAVCRTYRSEHNAFRRRRTPKITCQEQVAVQPCVLERRVVWRDVDSCIHHGLVETGILPVGVSKLHLFHSRSDSKRIAIEYRRSRARKLVCQQIIRPRMRALAVRPWQGRVFRIEAAVSLHNVSRAGNDWTCDENKRLVPVLVFDFEMRPGKAVRLFRGILEIVGCGRGVRRQFRHFNAIRIVAVRRKIGDVDGFGKGDRHRQFWQAVPHVERIGPIFGGIVRYAHFPHACPASCHGEARDVLALYQRRTI